MILLLNLKFFKYQKNNKEYLKFHLIQNKLQNIILNIYSVFAIEKLEIKIN